MGRTGRQAIAGAASTSLVTSEPRNPGQEGLGSYQQADSRLAKHRTSSVDIKHDQGDPVDDDEGQPSRSSTYIHSIKHSLIYTPLVVPQKLIFQL